MVDLDYERTRVLDAPPNPSCPAHQATAEAISLLEMLLRLNPKDRVTASEALSHRYFDRVRNVAKVRG